MFYFEYRLYVSCVVFFILVTRTFWGILYVGVRSLTEAQAVVDYTGEDGYK